MKLMALLYHRRRRVADEPGHGYPIRFVAARRHPILGRLRGDPTGVDGHVDGAAYPGPETASRRRLIRAIAVRGVHIRRADTT
jgi:hypothetical protein